MSCETWFVSMSAWVDGVSTVAEVEDLKTHLERCAECQMQYEQLGLLRSRLPDAYQLAPSEGFAARTAEKIQMQVALARRPKPALSDTLRMLWGTLAWTLTCMAGAALPLAWVNRDMADSFGSGSTAGAAFRAYSLPLPSNTLDFFSQSGWLVLSVLLMSGVGLWMLRPLSFVRRLRSAEGVTAGQVAGFGVGLWLVGLLAAVPALPGQLILLQSTDTLWSAYGWAAVWTALCLLLCGGLLFGTARSVNHLVWSFLACLLVASLAEPILAPSYRMLEARGGPTSRADDAFVDQSMHDRPFTLHDLPLANGKVNGDPIPSYLATRLNWFIWSPRPGPTWWTVVGVAGGLGLIGALLVGGPLSTGQRWAAPGLAILLLGVPLGGYLAGVLQARGLVEPPAAWSAMAQPHPVERQTVVSLLPEPGGTLPLAPVPVPGLLDAMLKAPPAGPDTWQAHEQAQVKQARALLLGDWQAFLDAVAHEHGTPWATTNVLSRMTTDGYGYVPSAVPNDGRMYCPMYREAALQLSRATGVWLTTRPGKVLPERTGQVRGRVWLNGRPAANVEVWLMPNVPALQAVSDELHGVARTVLETGHGYEFPIEVRTDTDGRFLFDGPPLGWYTPSLVLPGDVTQASTADPLPGAIRMIGSHTWDLGDVHVEVKP